MNKTYKTVRLDEDTYDLLLEYRRELEAINRSRISLAEAINISFGEMAGQEHAIADERLRYKKAHELCSCRATEKFAPPAD